MGNKKIGILTALKHFFVLSAFIF